MTIQNPLASTDNFYITTTVSMPNLDWVVCFWAKLEIQPTTTTIISVSSEGNCGKTLAHTLALIESDFESQVYRIEATTCIERLRHMTGIKTPWSSPLPAAIVEAGCTMAVWYGIDGYPF